MNKEDCVIGVKVANKSLFDGTQLGIIIGHVVEIDDSIKQDKSKLISCAVVMFNKERQWVELVPVDQLMTEAEGFKQISFEKAEEARLEKEFLAIKKQVSQKLKQAAKLLVEANTMLGDRFQTYKLKKEILPVISALKAGGWNTSNLNY